MPTFQFMTPEGSVFEIEAADQQKAIGAFRKRKQIESAPTTGQELTAPSSDVRPLRPEGLPELTGGFLTRGAFEAAGGTAGSVAGAPTGLPGIVGGGLLGAAGGSLAFDTAESFLRFIGTLEQTQKDPTAPLGEAFRAAKDDVLFGGGVQAAGALLGAVKPLLGKLLGVRSGEVDDVMQLARSAGITRDGTESLGAIDVTPGATGRLLRGAGYVLGIFPFIGSPFRKAAQEKADVVVGQVNRILNTMAPTATLSSDVGVDMVRAARNTQAEFRSTAANLYDNFRTLARNASRKEIVPTAPIKSRIANTVRESDAQRIVLDNGEIIEGAASDKMNDLLRVWQQLPENITIDQLQGQADRLKDIVDTARAEGFDVARFSNFKQGIEEAMASLNLSGLPAEEATRIQEAKRAADAFFSKGMALFQTPTGQKMGKVDKNLFRVGPTRPGSLNDDEIASAAINLKSPKAVQDLGRLVGQENMGKAARVHIERAWEDALIIRNGSIEGVNWDAFKSNIGLRPPKGIEQTGKADGLREFVRQSGVDPADFDRLIDVASRIEVPREVNKFIARRAALGGLGSAAAGASTAMIIGDSVISSMGVGLLLRHGAKILSDPAQLRAMRRVLTPNVPTQQRRMLLGRLLENYGQAQSELPEDEEANVGNGADQSQR